MYIEQIYTNCLSEATYYIESEGQVAIVDPLRDIDVYLNLAKKRKAKIKYILETHFHADFVSGHFDLALKTGADIIFGPSATTEFPIKCIASGERLPLGKMQIKALHTPGHTLESVSYLLIDERNQPKALFSGDTLFIGDVGRPDLLDGIMSKEELASMLYDSLNDKIKTLPDDVIVYPAHGAGSACGKNISSERSSTIGEQKKTNYALQEMTREEFIKTVNEGLGTPPAYFTLSVEKNRSMIPTISSILQKSLNALSPKEFASRLSPDVIILDTRKMSDFVKGYIKDSINVGIDGKYAIWVGNVIPTKTKILLVTEPGKEEESIVRLSRIGYDSVIGYLENGINSWIEQKLPIETIDEISAKDFSEIHHQKKGNVLDVRNTTEQQSGIVENAKTICLSKLPNQLGELNQNDTYYVHCAGGYRSVIACSLLKKHGFRQVVNITGGMQSIKKFISPKR